MYWVTLALLWSESQKGTITILEGGNKNDIWVVNSQSFDNETESDIKELIRFFRRNIFEHLIMQKRENSPHRLPVYIWIESPDSARICLQKWVSSQIHPLVHNHRLSKPSGFLEALEILSRNNSPNPDDVIIWHGTFHKNEKIQNEDLGNSDYFRKMFAFAKSLPVSWEKSWDVVKIVRKIWQGLGSIDKKRGSSFFRAYNGSILEDIRDICLASIYGDDFSDWYFSVLSFKGNVGITSKGEKNPPFSNITAIMMGNLFDEKEDSRPWFVKIKNRAIEK